VTELLLAIDVGNTNIVLGVFKNKELLAYWRLATHKELTEDEYGITLKALFNDKKIDPTSLKGAIISSVVPTITPNLEKMCEKYLSINAISIGPGIKTGINIKYENPREVGADRIVNTVAACNKYGGPIIIVDFGTATTFDAVNADMDYIGGAIAPGIGISSEALFNSAARLYRVEIARPQTVIGKNTAASMQSGIYYGFVGMVDNLVNKIKAEMGEQKVFTVATGGIAPLICKDTKTIDKVDMLLALDGLRMLYEKNIEL
jgi:type III pantothenate kinase